MKIRSLCRVHCDVSARRSVTSTGAASTLGLEDKSEDCCCLKGSLCLRRDFLVTVVVERTSSRIVGNHVWPWKWR